MEAEKPDLRFTYTDYTHLPEGLSYELIDGDFYMVPAPRPFHQIVAARVLNVLSRHVHKHDLGEVIPAPCDVKLSEYDVVQPDILFIAKKRLAIIEQLYVAGPPDLIVEVLSESDPSRDTEIKRKLYSRYGVREYWIVDLKGSVQMLIREQAELRLSRTFHAEETLVSQLLPDFRLDLSDVFRPLSA
ncbi:MAG: Uma2 family endonuclease [Acidobacteriota bacterium]